MHSATRMCTLHGELLWVLTFKLLLVTPSLQTRRSCATEHAAVQTGGLHVHKVLASRGGAAAQACVLCKHAISRTKRRFRTRGEDLMARSACASDALPTHKRVRCAAAVQEPVGGGQWVRMRACLGGVPPVGE